MDRRTIELMVYVKRYVLEETKDYAQKFVVISEESIANLGFTFEDLLEVVYALERAGFLKDQSTDGDYDERSVQVLRC